MRNFTKTLSLLFSLSLLYVSHAIAQQTDSTAKALVDSTALYKADSTLRAKGNKVSGILKDAATGKPIGGMSVGVLDYSGTLSDDKGRFTITIPNYDAILLVKGQGYQAKQIPLKGRKKLPDVFLLEETYHSIYDEADLSNRKVSLNQTTSAVNLINTQGAWEPTGQEMPDTYLQGKVAGLNVVRRSGTPNAGANLFLRGFSSLFGTNAPLLVVDGMIYDTFHYGNSINRGHIHNPYGNLDLHDVQSFTILKDAAANMYGTKAANGVILLSTNSHPDVATKIDLGLYSGYNYTGSNFFLPLMKAGDYRTYLSDVLKSSGMTPEQVAAQPYFNDSPSNPDYAAYHNDLNWQKRAFKNGYNQNYNLRVSGGDNVARYVLALGYGDNKGITPMTDLKKFNTRFNGDLNISKNFTVIANLSFNYNQQQLRDQGLATKTNPLYQSLVKSPFLRPNLVNAQGVESPNLADVDVFGTGNPDALIVDAQQDNRNYRFFGNITFKYDLSKSWSVQTLIGVTTDKVKENYFIPRKGVADDTIATGILDTRLGSQVQRLFNIYSDTRANYNHTFNRIHKVSANLGTRFTEYSTRVNTNTAFNSAVDELIFVGSGTPLFNRVGGDIGRYRWLNTYFTGDYSLYNKYLFSVSVAADGSSRFGEHAGGVGLSGTRLAVLPAVSAAWVISSEKFMSNLNFIEQLKLRASYGLTGNDDIGNYAARQYYVSQNLLGLQGIVRGNFGNPYLQWEVNKKLDIGFDAAFFHERVNLTVDYFKNVTSKMITRETAPGASGLLFLVNNNGGMQTSGLELSVNARVISTNNWKWDIGANIATYRNRIKSLPNSFVTNYAGATVLTQEGLPAGMFYGYRTNGIYNTNAEAVTSGISVRNDKGIPVNQQGGDVKFIDLNGDHIIDEADRQVIGNPNPDFTGGMSTGISYRRFNLNALVTFTKGNVVYNYTRRQLETASSANNQTTAIVNRWRTDGQQTSIPRAAFGDPTGNGSFSDRWLEDGSYIRLRTISLSYDVPLKFSGFKYLKVYATGNNLITFTKYLGYDPEFAPTGNLLTNGIDNLLEPQFSTVQLGLRIGI